MLTFISCIILFNIKVVYSNPAECCASQPIFVDPCKKYAFIGEDSLQIARYHLQLAHELYDKGLFKQAVLNWKKVLRLQPDNAFAMFMLGKSYLCMGEEEKGAVYCDKAMLLGKK